MRRGPDSGLSEEEMGMVAPRADIAVADSQNEKEKNPELKVKMSGADLKNIEVEMDIQRERPGFDGGQKIAFEGAALQRVREMLNEGAKKIEFSPEDIKKCRERMEKDIFEAFDIKTKAGLKKVSEINAEDAVAAQKEGRGAIVMTKEETQKLVEEMIASERSWITEFQKSYLFDVLGKEKFKENGLEVTKEEWDGMAIDLQNKIKEKDWHNVIPRAGHMHNLLPEKFDTEVLLLLTDEDKKGIMGEIQIMRKGNPSDKNPKRQKGDPWEMASRVRYVSEFLPELKDEIVIDEEDWKLMEDHLDKVRKAGDNWAVSYQLCNMKIIERLANRREIKVSTKKTGKIEAAR